MNWCSFFSPPIKESWGYLIRKCKDCINLYPVQCSLDTPFPIPCLKFSLASAPSRSTSLSPTSINFPFSYLTFILFFSFFSLLPLFLFILHVFALRLSFLCAELIPTSHKRRLWQFHVLYTEPKGDATSSVKSKDHKRLSILAFHLSLESANTFFFFLSFLSLFLTENVNRQGFTFLFLV